MTDSPARSVVYERTIPYSTMRVWRALTEPASIAQWLYDNDFRPVVGHRFQFRGKPRPHWDGIVESEVLAVDPEKRLSYRWDASGGAPGTGLRTVVTWTLAAADGGTHVHMEQSGFRSEEEAKGPSSGWERLFNSLERVVASLK